MIKITTDSTCDLPARVLEAHNISVIPLGIVKGGKLYRDGVDIRTADIAAYVDGGGDITTTNAVNIADYEVLFRAEAAKYDAVIHINIGPGFSCCHQNAKLAAEEVPEVYVVSSENLSVGHGLMVLAAAEAAEAGKSVGEILALLEDMTARIEMSFVLDRLDYMKKGGRCSAVTALGANLLKLHPCIEVIDGKMGVTKKYRGSIEKAVRDYLRERLANRTDIDTRRVILVDTCQDDRLAAIGREYLQEDGRFAEVLEAKAGCTIFSHSGPGTLGIVFLRN
jgi:DegV family protein with EDD domain